MLLQNSVGHSEYRDTSVTHICAPYQISFGCSNQEKNWIRGACSTYVGKRGAHRVLVWRPEGMRTTGKPGRIRDDNIKIDLQ